jgi:YD repeat-containing protein
MIGLVGLLVLALGLALNSRLLLSDTRYFMALWAFFPVMVGIGLANIRFRLEWLLALWMITGVTASLNRDFVADVIGVGLFDSVFPWQTAAEELTPYAQAGDLVTFTLPDGLTTWLQWEANGHYMYDMETNRGVRRWIVASDTGYEEALTLEDEPFDRVWTAYMRPKPALLAEFEEVLVEDYIRCGSVISNAPVLLDLYAHCEVCCPPEQGKALVRFGEGIAISGLEPLPDEVSDSLHVRLGWLVADDVPRYTYSIALHVEDETGQLVAQADYGLPEQRFSCTPVNVALGEVPSGAYQLLAAVYAWETGERLTGIVVATGETGDRLALATFRVSDAQAR